MANDLEGENWRVIYLNSLYFSFITMATVGYGDISPINSYEKMFGICVTITCCGIYGFALNCIG